MLINKFSCQLTPLIFPCQGTLYKEGKDYGQKFGHFISMCSFMMVLLSTDIILILVTIYTSLIPPLM